MDLKRFFREMTEKGSSHITAWNIRIFWQTSPKVTKTHEKLAKSMGEVLAMCVKTAVNKINVAVPRRRARGRTPCPAPVLPRDERSRAHLVSLPGVLIGV